MPLRPAAHHQFAACQLRTYAQLRHPGDTQAFQRHTLEAVGHGGFVNGRKAQGTLAQQQIHRAAQERAGAVGQQRHTALAFQVEQRLAIGIGGTHREHFGVTQVQRRENLGVHLHRRVRVIERQHQVATAFAQGVHGVADVGGHQPRGNVQPFVAQLRDPAWEEPQGQGVGGRHLHDFALPAFQMMQMAQHFAQLFDHRARRHQKQLPGRCQLHRRA